MESHSAFPIAPAWSLELTEDLGTSVAVAAVVVAVRYFGHVPVVVVAAGCA